METLSLNLSEPLLQEIQVLANQDGSSVSEFLIRAASEKVASLREYGRVQAEIASAQSEDLRSYLAAVPYGPVADTDRLTD